MKPAQLLHSQKIMLWFKFKFLFAIKNLYVFDEYDFLLHAYFRIINKIHIFIPRE